jgi:hypothetical protein
MRVIERASTILVTIVAVLLIWRLAEDRWGGSANRNPGSRQADVSALVGKDLNLAADLQRGADATLVLAISTHCHFCEESVPFYRRLAKIRSTVSNELRMVAVLPQDNASGSAYLTENGIAVDRLISKPLHAIQVKGTPTLLLLGADGKVRKAWVGRLDSSREKEVITALKGLCGHCTTT